MDDQEITLKEIQIPPSVAPNIAEIDWIQKGPYLIGRGPTGEFGMHLGMKRMMTGVDDNNYPILRKVSV